VSDFVLGVGMATEILTQMVAMSANEWLTKMIKTQSLRSQLGPD
jgi:hypothetical protein